MMKKFLSLLMALTMILSLSVGTVLAADVETPDDGYETVEAYIMPENGARSVSWGKITLKMSGTKSAYAKTSTYSGKAYYIYAKITGRDAEGAIGAKTKSANNASSVATDVAFSRNSKKSVTWTGLGKIQDTKDSATKKGTVTRTQSPS